ncbi:glycoside hydrolase family 78 protein [Olivibacter ginsenosidimutans]|uniref:alpha-L-rhamnosidase n=2 Tax=Olivibacter ginsenosidimutans TaxID=1176537 RepID=A0ABP9BUJ5_9SPHI
MGSTIRPDELTCEYLKKPLGLDVHLPRFSWTLAADKRDQQQMAYELIVADNLEAIQKKKGTVWSTGKVVSEQNIQVVYKGKPLQSFTRYYWCVRVYDKQGKVSDWSEPEWFETAMLASSDWTGQWIGDGSKQFTRDENFYGDDPMPLFRKSFHVSKNMVSARLYVSGLGYYEAYLNGSKIGDHVLDPGWTTYDKQVLYSVYDISKQLSKGDNVIGFMLGNGWYNPLPLRFWGNINMRDALETGRPKVKAMLRLTYRDGTVKTIATGGDWQTAPGPVIRNNIYLGEHDDGRRYDPDWCTVSASSNGWKQAVEVEGPAGVLTAQRQPPIRVTKRIKPVRIRETSPGTFVADMGQNFAGVVGIRVKGPAGTKIVLRYGEDVYPDGNVNVMTTVAGQIKQGNGGPGAPPVAWQEDSYILNGKGVETWAPRFTFHGFRYVEIKGWPGKPTVEDIEGLRMNTDLAEKGQFASSNALFNQLQENIRWTFMSNVFSTISDCPGRERLPYGGDILCTAETFMYNYGMANFYAKIIRDFANEQRTLGGITETAPFVGIADAGPGDQSGPLGFQLGFSYIIKKMYDFYGDKRIVEENYEAVRKQVEFLRTRATQHLLDTDLGDHESLAEKSIPLTASIFYYQQVCLLTDMATILGKGNDATLYANLAKAIKKAIIQKFAQGKGQFGKNTQSDLLFGLWSGVVDTANDEGLWKTLMDAFEEKKGHLSTGIFGTKMLFDVLRSADEYEMAYRIANQRDFPGWGYMVAHGATTLWETWKASDNTFSKNHPMFGSIGEWFFRSLVGINEAAPGFKKIIIKPQPAGDLCHAKGSFQSVYGRIGSAWNINEKGFNLEVEIPVNTTAEVWVPLAYGKEVIENGTPLKDVPELRFLRNERGYAVIAMGSGHYRFATMK